MEKAGEVSPFLPWPTPQGTGLLRPCDREREQSRRTHTPNHLRSEEPQPPHRHHQGTMKLRPFESPIPGGA